MGSRATIEKRYGERVLDWLDDLITHCDEAEQLVTDGRSVLMSEWRQQRAAEAVLGRIGDTASHLPQQFRDEFDGQPWRLIVGIRIKVAHNLDYDQVWTALVGAIDLRTYIENNILDEA